jgi:hypothetical protein
VLSLLKTIGEPPLVQLITHNFSVPPLMNVPLAQMPGLVNKST